MTDAAMSLEAFTPGKRPDSRSPEDVANSLSDEELENGPLGGIFKGIKASPPQQLTKLRGLSGRCDTAKEKLLQETAPDAGAP